MFLLKNACLLLLNIDETYHADTLKFISAFLYDTECDDYTETYFKLDTHPCTLDILMKSKDSYVINSAYDVFSALTFTKPDDIVEVT